MRSGHAHILALACLAAGAVAAPVRAFTLSYSATLPVQTTSWAYAVEIPRFNPAMGVLQSVTVSVRDSLVAGFMFENLSSIAGASMRDSSRAVVQVLRPDNSGIVSASAAVERTASVGVFDGWLDYAGTSGVTLGPVVAVGTASAILVGGADISMFSGLGNVSLPCRATGFASLSSVGENNRNIVTTAAGCAVTVTYTYLRTTRVAASTWGTLRRQYR
ncbi:MAG: choice-of-anchor E domain-containing protein [Candidatus Eisenbacteria bacterium]|nr:choice-of-anchor E domain-containing protein [Candidatus Eisenbacteria bacterium]